MARTRRTEMNYDAMFALLRQRELVTFTELARAGLGYRASRDSKCFVVALHALQKMDKVRFHDIRHGTKTRRMYSAGERL